MVVEKIRQNEKEFQDIKTKSKIIGQLMPN